MKGNFCINKSLNKENIISNKKRTKLDQICFNCDEIFLNYKVHSKTCTAIQKKDVNTNLQIKDPVNTIINLIPGDDYGYWV
jgi:hypothetical protein